MTSGALSPIAPSRSFQSFSRSQDSRAGARLSLSPLDPFYQQQINMGNTNSPSNSSQSSPSSSVPNTPTGSNLNATAPVYHQRPSSLHGLKHKLHSIGTGKSNSRRKSYSNCHSIPLSPLARTPSPSPCGPASPTRSPSPLAFCLGHHPGGLSNLTQIFTPSSSNNKHQQQPQQQCNTANTKIHKAHSFKTQSSSSSEKNDKNLK